MVLLSHSKCFNTWNSTIWRTAFPQFQKYEFKYIDGIYFLFSQIGQTTIPIQFRFWIYFNDSPGLVYSSKYFTVFSSVDVMMFSKSIFRWEFHNRKNSLLSASMCFFFTQTNTKQWITKANLSHLERVSITCTERDHRHYFHVKY